MAGEVPEDGDGEKDMFSMLEHDEEAEEEKKKKLVEEEEEEAKDEPSREIIKDNEVSLQGKSSAFNCALKNASFFNPSCYLPQSNVITSGQSASLSWCQAPSGTQDQTFVQYICMAAGPQYKASAQTTQKTPLLAVPSL
jgi:hypothetical protein